MKRERKTTGSVVGKYTAKYPKYLTLEQREVKYARGNKKRLDFVAKKKKLI